MSTYVWVLMDEGVCGAFCDDPSQLAKGNRLCTDAPGCWLCPHDHSCDYVYYGDDNKAWVIGVFDTPESAKRILIEDLVGGQIIAEAHETDTEGTVIHYSLWQRADGEDGDPHRYHLEYHEVEHWSNSPQSE